MAAIPGWAYLGAGIFMIVYSRLVNIKTQSNALTIFFIIGIIFAIIGIGKMFYHGAIKRKQQDAELAMGMANLTATPEANQPGSTAYPRQHNPVAAEQQFQAHQAMHHANFNPQQPHQVHKAHDPQHLSIITCPACETRHYSYANYCMRCGARIKR